MQLDPKHAYFEVSSTAFRVAYSLRINHRTAVLQEYLPIWAQNGGVEGINYTMRHRSIGLEEKYKVER